MTKTAQLLIEEMKRNNLNYLPVQEVPGGDTVVPLGFQLDNVRFKIYTIFDKDEHSVCIRCFDFLKVNEDQFPKAVLCCNSLNNKMRWVKFTVDDDLNINITDDAIIDEFTGGKEVLELVMRMASIANDAYPELNRAIWA